jgi:hypothetical protein
MPRRDLPERKFGPTSYMSYAQNAEGVVLSRAFADPELDRYADIGVAPEPRNPQLRPPWNGGSTFRFAHLIESV